MDVTITIPEQRLADLLCCGFEGGVGYWCVITGYETPDEPRSAWGDAEIFPHVDYPLCGGAVLCETEVDEQIEPKKLVLNREAIERGLHIMAEKYPRHWGDFLAGNEDACTGDVFIQCCLLGEVVYG